MAIVYSNKMISLHLSQFNVVDSVVKLASTPHGKFVHYFSLNPCMTLSTSSAVFLYVRRKAKMVNGSCLVSNCQLMFVLLSFFANNLPKYFMIFPISISRGRKRAACI